MPDAIVLDDSQFDSFMSAITEKMEPAIAAQAKAAVGELGLDKVERKGGIFAGVKGGDLPAREKGFRFMRAVLSGDHQAAKALGEGTGSLGGYLAPVEFVEEVIARLPAISELAPLVRVIPVGSDTGSLPSLVTDISVTWSGAAAASQNAAFAGAEPAFGSITWALKRADAITKLSRELVADSRPGVIEFISRLFQEAIARGRDKVIAIGDGTTQPLGLVNTTGISEVAVGGALSYTKLINIEQALARKYRANARWVMNSTNVKRIYSLLDGQSRPIFTREMVGGNPASMLLGYPIAQQDNLPDGTIFFGDLSQYLWFDRGEMGIESTNEGGDAFEKHQTWIKVWERADGKLGLTEAFAKGTGITDPA